MIIESVAMYGQQQSQEKLLMFFWILSYKTTYLQFAYHKE